MASAEGLRAGRPSRLDQLLAAADPPAGPPADPDRAGMKRAHSTSTLEGAPRRRVIRHTRYIRAASAEPPPPPALLGFICNAESQRRATSATRRQLSSACSSTESLNALMDGARRGRRGSSQESTCSTTSTLSVRSVGGRPVKSAIVTALPRRGAKLTADVRAPWTDPAKKTDHAPRVIAAPTLPPIGGGASRVSMVGTTRVSTGYLDRVVADIPHHLEQLERQLGLHSSMSSVSTLDVESVDTALGLELDDDVTTPSGSFENLLTDDELSHVTSAITGASASAASAAASAPVPASAASSKGKVGALQNLEARYERIISRTAAGKPGILQDLPTTTTTEPESEGASALGERGAPEAAVQRKEDGAPAAAQTVTKETGVLAGRAASPAETPQPLEEGEGATGVREEEKEKEAGISAAGVLPSTPPPPPPTPTPPPPLSPSEQADSCQPPTSLSSNPGSRTMSNVRPLGLLETEINDALEADEIPIEVEVIPEVDMEPSMRDHVYRAPPSRTQSNQRGATATGHPSDGAAQMDPSLPLPESMLSAYEDYVRPVESTPVYGGVRRYGEAGSQRPLAPEAMEVSRVTLPTGAGERVEGKPADHMARPHTGENSATPHSAIPPGRVVMEGGSSQQVNTTLEQLAPGPHAGSHTGESGMGAKAGANRDIPIPSSPHASPQPDPTMGQAKEVKVTTPPEKPRLKGILKKTSSYEIKEPEVKDIERTPMKGSERQPHKNTETPTLVKGEVKVSQDNEIRENKDSQSKPSKVNEVKPSRENHVGSEAEVTQQIKPQIKPTPLEVKDVKPKSKEVSKPEVKVSQTDVSDKAAPPRDARETSVFPTLTDVLSVKSFNPGALDVRTRLTILDVTINFLLLTPLTVLYYYSTCRLLELSLLHMFPRLGAWLLLLVGACIEFSASFWQRTLAARAPKPEVGRPPFADVNIPFLLTAKAYNFVLGFGNVCHMLAMTSVVDLYVGDGWDVSLRAALTSVVVLWTLRCSRNVVAPPLYVGIDADDPRVFASTTMFKVEPDLSAESSADILGTVGVVMSFVHLHWAGVWNCADAALFPSSFALSMLTSLLLGSGICLLFMLLQQAAVDISRNLEREKKEPLRLAFENVFITSANVGVILLWRGLWMVYDIMADYFPIYCRAWDITPLAACVLSFLLLALAHCSSSVLFQGCEVDGELTDGAGVRFTSGYFTEILHVEEHEVKKEDRSTTKLPPEKTAVHKGKGQEKPLGFAEKSTMGSGIQQSKSPNGTTTTSTAATTTTAPVKSLTSLKQKND